jgi:hypothetical protein
MYIFIKRSHLKLFFPIIILSFDFPDILCTISFLLYDKISIVLMLGGFCCTFLGLDKPGDFRLEAPSLQRMGRVHRLPLLLNHKNVYAI